MPHRELAYPQRDLASPIEICALDDQKKKSQLEQIKPTNSGRI